MKTEKLFTERQYFKQIWLWALLLSIDGLFIFGLVKQVFLGQSFGAKPISNGLLIIITLAILLLTLLFIFSRLDTAIQRDGIYYRFLPFQWQYKKIGWDRISKSFVREYSPLTEYGGWGIRMGIFGKGQTFNVSGDKGLQLVYDDGKKFLIGTQRPKDIEQVLEQLGHATADN